ncbi:MAG TPA: hypothetical protein VFA32_14795 [Dehalococcoidia bacterium]|nr:hypothetical protein [Dehalococcoidia bacterium]
MAPQLSANLRHPVTAQLQRSTSHPLQRQLPLSNAATSNPEAVELLKALLEGIPDYQYLEIRTIKKGRGARKKFYKLSRLRAEGFEVALPDYLDGKANIYYGVAPRFEPRPAESDTDRGDAVNLVTSLWLDEITRPAPDLPPFSWMVETSVGKVQAGYLLKEPTSDTELVEQLNRRLGAAVGGDNVWNRGRILRLPGYINLNHPGNQRAHLLGLHPNRRYTLEDLDRLLPPMPQEDTDGGPRRLRGQQHTGSFNPHWPYALSPELQDRLVDFFRG